MYGQPNYVPQFRQGPRTSVPPANQQRLPALPPPPQGQYQQGLQAGPPPVIQQGTPAIPPHIGQQGPYLYQHGFPAPHSTVHRTSPIALRGMSNTGQSYRHPPPTGHGSNLVSPWYSNSQHTVHHPSHMGTQNLHPPASVPPHGPLPPPPPRPAAATQGSLSYETMYLQQPHTGGTHGFHHIPPLPPPPPPPPLAFNLAAPTTVGSSMHLTVGDSHMPCMAPLRPASPQPPLPPLPAAPPLSSSSSPSLAASDFPGHMYSDASLNKLPMSGMRDLNSIDEAKAGNEFRCITAVHEDSKSNENGSGYQGSSLAGGISSTGTLMLDVSPPPPKPLGEKVIHKIERANESPLKASVIDSSAQREHLNNSSGCSLHADSDMEMEDDITLSDREGISDSIDALNCKNSFIDEELDVKNQLYGPQSSPERTRDQGSSCEMVPCSLSSELCEISQGQDVLFEQRRSTIEKSPSRVNNLYSTGAAEFPLPADLEKSSIPLADDQNTFTAPEAAEANNSDGISNQFNGVRSPFGLLQDYASDRSSENDDFEEDANGIIAPPPVTDAPNSSQQDTGSHLKAYMGCESPCMTDKESRPPPESEKLYKAETTSVCTKKEVEDTSIRLITIESHEAFQENDASDCAGIDVVTRRGKSQEDRKAKVEPLRPKVEVDEFGRFVREDSINSNSDDTRHNKRHNKNGRSRIRSRSPIDRRRRSSRRRRENRSHSRSWSSRNERNRSRSPSSRSSSSRSPSIRRRSRSRSPSSCSSRSGSPTIRHRSRSRSPTFRRRSRSRSPTFRHRSRSNSPTFRRRSRSRSPTIRHRSRSRSSTFRHRSRSRSSSFRRRNRSRSPTFRRRSRSRSPTFRRAGGFRNGNKRQDRRQIPGCFDFLRGKCFRGASCRYMHHESQKNDTSRHHRSNQKQLESEPGLKSSWIKEEVKHISATNLPDEFKDQELAETVAREDGQLIEQKEDSFFSDLSPEPASKKVSSVESLPKTTSLTPLWPMKSSNGQPLSSEQFSSQLLGHNGVELPVPSFSAANIPFVSQLPPPPPLPPPSQGTGAVHVQQVHRDYNLVPPYPLQSTPTGVIHSYQDSLPNQHSQFSLPPNHPWTSLPPPPPRPQYDSSLNGGTAARGVSSQFQQSHLAPRNDFGSQTSVRPSAIGLPSHSQAGDYLHQTHPPVRDFRGPLLHRDNLGSGNLSSQPTGGPGLVREDQFTDARGQKLNSSDAFPHGNMYAQPAPPSRESRMNKIQNFSGNSFPSSELLNSSAQVDTLSQNQQPATCGMQYPIGNSTLGVPGKTGLQYLVNDSNAGFPGQPLSQVPVDDSNAGFPMPQFSTDIQDRNHSSQLSDFGASRIPPHHIPYASTFEQPLSQVPVDEQGVGSVGSRQTSSSPSLPRAVGQLLPNSDTEQYDPLLDGYEPSSNKSSHGQNQKFPSDSNIMERLSGSRQPLDVEEKKKYKEVDTVASATSLDIDEYGETADAEVGVVEYESLSDPDGVPNMAAGEFEIDQGDSAGKSKKKKDSRSSRLFKSAIADFVKEMLKPSWRQGNMSKEAFKTIVKKTVDKVSGAMKKHQIPKSQAKINQYIDSSQRKLKKLVKGYVDKFVNV